MRIENYNVGSYLHIVKRGQRKQPITRDVSDQWRFLKLIKFLNDSNVAENWLRDSKNLDRPDTWLPQKPLVKILAYCLMPNHFHLLVKEITKGGVTLFMKKLGNSMTGHFNLKYKEVGSLFQGSYKSKTIKEDRYLMYLAVYIMVKNPFELYPGGINKAVTEFDKAFEWIKTYPFVSLQDFLENRSLNIIEKDILKDLLPRNEFKEFAKDCIIGRAEEFKMIQV
jgi:putative transposase